MGHCWWSKDKLLSNILLWTPSHWCVSVGQPRRTYQQQLCMDTGCSLEDLPEAMDDRDEWWERELRKYMQAARHDDNYDDINQRCFLQGLISVWSIPIWLYMRIGWSVHWLNKIISWNVSVQMRFIFFNIVNCTHLSLVKRHHQQQIWHHHMNFSASSYLFVRVKNFDI